MLAVVFVLTAHPAGAVSRDPTARAETRNDGVDVVFVRSADGTATGYRRGGHSSCEWHAVPYTTTGDGRALPVEVVGAPPSPDHVLYVIWCGPRSYVRWLGPRDFTDDPARPLAEELVRRVTVVPAGVDVRPDTRGVTGVASLFWIEGYGDEPLEASESAFGLTVAVTVRLTGVEWDFGDGTPPVRAGLGEAWPERSSVRHTYRDASGGTPYEVTARLLLAPSYTVNGAAATELDPIVVPVTRAYDVHEIQAVRRR